MKPGIYKIIVTTDESKYAYIGQTMHLNKRWTHHLHHLRREKHVNSFMQRLFNKYGESSFQYIIQAECPVDELTIFEQRYLDMETFQKINLGTAVDAPRRGQKNSEKHREALKKYNENKIVSEETRRRMSEAGKGRTSWNKGQTGVQEAWNKGKQASNETKKKLSDAHKGKPWSEARRKAYELKWAVDALG